jgi:hypothetical protein
VGPIGPIAPPLPPSTTVTNPVSALAGTTTVIVYRPIPVYVADKTTAGAPLIVTGGVANALLVVPEGTLPLATAGLTAPRPVASSTNVSPGVV